MVCVHCGGKTQVINSRAQKRLNQVWRRRRCLVCQAIFTTEEVTSYPLSWSVRRPTAHVEPFLRDKLFLSLYQSCQHRKTPIEDAEALTATVIKSLLGMVRNGLLDNHQISRAAQVALARFDKAAAVHYAAFHK